MRIDIISDVICPWCFVGKRRLAAALSQRAETTAAVSWHPFQLNPDMPLEGMPRERYLAAKFGGGQQASRIYENLTSVGAAVGIPFAFDRIKVTPNTRDAHRLIRHAGTIESTDPVVEGLFKAYFTEGRDTGDTATLVEIADEAGLDKAGVERYLASDAAVEDTIAEDLSARRIGITAVPCFIFEKKYVVSGAQEPEFFFPLFDLLRNEHAAGEPVSAK